jgi:hypothetical protein
MQAVNAGNAFLHVCCAVQVLGHMKQMMEEHSSSGPHSFLLDDDSTLPFVVNEILVQIDDKVGELGSGLVLQGQIAPNSCRAATNMVVHAF